MKEAWTQIEATGSAEVGTVLAFLFHILQVPLAYLSLFAAETFHFRGDMISWMFAPVSAIGISQWLYLGPAIWFARRRGYSRIAAGLAIGGGLTLLINSACFGVMLL